jgi:hypothetical protein
MPFIDIAERVGREKDLLAGIEVGLDLKFGAEGLALMTELRQVQDNEVLWDVLQAIKAVASPEELRKVWSRKRRPRKRRRK